MQIRLLKKQIEESLCRFGIDATDAAAESELIIEYITGLNSIARIMQQERTLTAEEKECLDLILSEREKRKPIQYCLQQAYFMGLKFFVEEGVLIPRSDTESVVEQALKEIAPIDNPKIAEIGVGSGAIIISLLVARADALAEAVDISDKAIAVTQKNARLHNVDKRLHLIHDDCWQWLENCRANTKKFDMLVSNPPYIPLAQKESLAPEVALYEPPVALYGEGEEGLGFYHRLADCLSYVLKPGGVLVLEVGDTAGAKVVKILKQLAWHNVHIYNDLNKLPRVVVARNG